jgi:protease I
VPYRSRAGSPSSSPSTGFEHEEPGATFAVDRTVDEVDADEYDALVVPGGVGNPDKLRTNDKAVAFVRDFVEEGKPAAVICHGPWMLVEANVVRGRQVTSWPSLRTDIRNAGGIWQDEPVVVDDGLITSRKPDDLPQFCQALVREFEQGARRHAATGRAGAGS